MIDLVEVSINSLADYDKLLDLVEDSRYINHDIVAELKQRVGTKVKVVIVEWPYRDLDFSSVYSSYYSKKHKPVPKDCYRLHFFSDDSLSRDAYRGFLVLRPSLTGC